MFLKKLLAMLSAIFMLLNLVPFAVGAQTVEEHIHDENCEIDHVCSVSYASEETEEFIYSPGDLNADGNFNSIDLAVTRKVLFGVEVEDIIKENLDCSGDYDSNILDLVRLKKHIVAVDAVEFEYTVENNQVTITGFVGEISGCVTIPSKIEGMRVTAIGAGAFSNCANITSVLMPSSVLKIESSAFLNCTSLISVALPNSIVNIEEKAFEGCSKLFSIKLPCNITVLADDLFSLCESLKKIKIPEDVVEIGNSAFKGCCSLVEMNLPPKVTVLNEGAFFGCSKLVFINMPENLKEIKAYTFYGCEKLESITIPITVVNVGDRAFEDCSSLLSIVVPYETAFGENVFAGCSVLVVEGLFGSGGMDAAINSGVDYKPMECGHSEFILLYAKNPDCQTIGYSGDKYCINCGKIEEKGYDVPKTAHVTELVGYKEVTCEEDGYTGSLKCTTCNKYISHGYIVYSEGHYAAEMPGYIKPTCVSEGVYGVFTCEKCNEFIDNLVIPATGHDYYYSGQKDADCVNDGYTGDRKCFDCGYIESYGEVTPKGEHNYELTGEKYATCEKEGYSGDVVCTGCGDVKSKGTVTVKDHTPITDNYKTATCTEKGYSGDSYCEECKKELEKGKELPILGHTSVLINYKEATCEEDGYTGDQICSVCKVLVAWGKEIPKTDHKLVLVNQRDCTETQSGYTGDLVCETCGKVVEKGTVIPANHDHTMKTVNAVEPTCEKEGYSGDSQCEECGYTIFGETLPVKEHDCETKTVAPTCTEEGYTVDECKNCDYENKYDFVSALDHDWDEEWNTEKEATCTEDGKKYKNCSRCEEILTETIPATGHTETERSNVKEATCEEEGYTGDFICFSCGMTVYGETTPKIEHSFADWQVRCYHSDTPAAGGGLDGAIGEELSEYAERYHTCENCGTEETELLASGDEMYDIRELGGNCAEETEVVYSCKYCDHTHSTTIPPIGHSYVETIVPPTCSSEGYTSYTCSVCGDSYEDNRTEKLEHNMKIVNAVEPTCTTEGYTGDSECEECGYTVSGETLPVKAHDCETKTVAPTCIEEGYTVDECKNCDYENKYDFVSALDHDWDGEWHTEKEATCTEDGERNKKCLRCEEIFTETIPATGHTETELVNVKEATCEEEGYTGDLICSGCGTTIIGEITPKLEHSFGDWQIICFHSDSPSMDDGFIGGGVDGDFGGDTSLEYAEGHRICAGCGTEETEVLASGGEMYDISHSGGSCITSSETIYSCKYCDYYYSEIGEMTGHNYEETVVSPTCMNGGYTLYTCINCGDSYKDNYTDVTEHNLVDNKCTMCEMTIVESDHPYANSLTKEWILSYDGAEYLNISFSSDTLTESNWDKIYIYDGSGNQLGVYSGTQLASKTLTITGDSVKIKLVADGSVNKYGFYAVVTPVYNLCSCGSRIANFTVVTEPTCNNSGEKIGTCDNCGETISQTIPKLEHNRKYNVGSYYADVCGGECFSGNTVCTLCNEILEEGYYYQREHGWDSLYGQCYECGECCSHEGYKDPDSDYFDPWMSDPCCGICGFAPCQNCYTWSHSDVDCPNRYYGYWCDICGMEHMDPGECMGGGYGYWCDICQIEHMDPSECMGGGEEPWLPEE